MWPDPARPWLVLGKEMGLDYSAMRMDLSSLYLSLMRGFCITQAGGLV